jgi:hypothetical protein
MMHNLLPTNFELIDMWYAVPLIIVVSLVYSATRHEEPVAILTHALRFGLWIAGFMAVVFGVLLVITALL